MNQNAEGCKVYFRLATSLILFNTPRMSKLNWKVIASDFTSLLTIVSIIPYDKGTMDLINKLVPVSWIPTIIYASAGSTFLLRVWNWFERNKGRYTLPGSDATITATTTITASAQEGLTPNSQTISSPVQGIIPQQPK